MTQGNVPSDTGGPTLDPRLSHPNHRAARFSSRAAAVLLCVVVLNACSIIDFGRYKGIEWTGKDERYYKVKELVLGAGASSQPRTFFDHTLQEAVVLSFIPIMEKNHYITKTIWKDPLNQEFRTVRQTHDVKEEGKDGSDRPRGGSRRVHSMPTRLLREHKPGLWTVELFIDDELVRRLTFTIQ